MFIYCQTCRRYYREAKGHACPVPLVKRKPVVWSWLRPWHVSTKADAKIARKFRNTKTQTFCEVRS